MGAMSDFISVYAERVSLLKYVLHRDFPSGAVWTGTGWTEHPRGPSEKEEIKTQAKPLTMRQINSLIEKDTTGLVLSH